MAFTAKKVISGALTKSEEVSTRPRGHGTHIHREIFKAEDLQPSSAHSERPHGKEQLVEAVSEQTAQAMGVSRTPQGDTTGKWDRSICSL